MHGTFFLVICQVFHDFQSLWEPWNVDVTGDKPVKSNAREMSISKETKQNVQAEHN